MDIKVCGNFISNEYLMKPQYCVMLLSLLKRRILFFSWDEHNAETLMVDPHGELYIISKVDGGRGKYTTSLWRRGRNHPTVIT